MHAGALNDSFTTKSYIKSIGEGILTPLQKPGKPKGPATSLRPLTCKDVFTLVDPICTVL